MPDTQHGMCDHFSTNQGEIAWGTCAEGCTDNPSLVLKDRCGPDCGSFRCTWPKFYLGAPEGCYEMPPLVMVAEAAALPEVLKTIGWEGDDIQWLADALLDDGKMDFCDGWVELTDFAGVHKYFNGVLRDVRYDFCGEKPSPKTSNEGNN